jgi:hypothetical protein
VLPPIRLTSPPKTPSTPAPPAVAAVTQVKMDASFWRPLLLGLGTRPTGTQMLRGATGIDHRVIDVGIDAERRRLVVLNDAPDPMVAAFIQSDLQQGYPEQKVIVTRTSLVDIDSSMREMVTKNGLSSLRLKDLMQMVQSKQISKENSEQFLGTFLQHLMGDPKVQSHSAGAFVLQLINQFTRLNWSSLAIDNLNESDVTLDTVLSSEGDKDIEDQLGICTMPVYMVTADQLENIKTSQTLDAARELLLQMGVWGYFFPDSAELTLGLVEHGFDTPQKLVDTITLAPKHGHLIAEKEEVPELERVLGDLQARGLIVEGEMKVKVSAAGAKTRALVKFKPKESLFVKLKNLASIVVPIAKLFR